jgi:hypothetical protein
MHEPRRRSFATRSLVAALVVVTTGCATGQRPTLVEQTAGTEDAAATAVIQRLDVAAETTFTATYDITPTSTSQTTTATVFVSGLRQRIVIGSVDYINDGTVARTCVAGGGECAEGIDDARISNLQITHDFWGSAMGARLARAANVSLTAGVPRVETIAGQPATCADITVPSANAEASGGALGTLVYCALEAGPLGRYTGADVSIALTSYTPTVDETQLAR